jgi:drug/metabolite transporter (DMT)-like permease
MTFSNLLARSLLLTRSDAIVAADRDGIIRFWHPGAERVFGHLVPVQWYTPGDNLAVVAIDPLFLTAARATIAGIAGLSVLVILGRSMPPSSLWHEIFLSGLCTILGFPVLMALAMVSVPAAHGGVVLGIVPLATAGAAALVAHERPSAGFWGTSLVGAVIVVAFVLSQGEALALRLRVLRIHSIEWSVRLSHHAGVPAKPALAVPAVAVVNPIFELIERHREAEAKYVSDLQR